MDVEQLAPPDLPLPPGRTELRADALVREIRAGAGRRSTTPWKVGIPLVSTCVLVVAIAIAALPPHSDLAGSWTPDPDPVSPVDMAAAGTACSAELARASAHWPIKPAAMTPVLAERRGRLTAVMMMGDRQYGMCVIIDGDNVSSTLGEVEPFEPSTGVLLEGAPGLLNGSIPFRLAYGQVAPSVAHVTIKVADGRTVEATVAGGRFFAWWPSGADPSTIVATDDAGTVVATVRQTATTGPVEPSRSPGSR